MSCSVAALEFAYKRLAAISVLTGLEAAEIYDCFYERARHALLLIHAFVPATGGDRPGALVGPAHELACRSP